MKRRKRIIIWNIVLCSLIHLVHATGVLQATIIYEIESGHHARTFNLTYENVSEGESLLLCHHAIAPPDDVQCSAFEAQVGGFKIQQLSSIFPLKAPTSSNHYYYNTQIYLMKTKDLIQPFTIPISLHRQDQELNFVYHYKFPSSLKDVYKLAHHFCTKENIHKPHDCADGLTREVSIMLQRREPLYVMTHSFHPTTLSPMASASTPPSTIIDERSIGIIINSNTRFIQQTIQPLLSQLIDEAGWPADSIFVGVGKGVDGPPPPPTLSSSIGSSQEQGGYAKLVKYRFLIQDMMDFNGLWSFIEEATTAEGDDNSNKMMMLKETEWLFLMHDTIEVGPGFRQGLVAQANKVLQVYPEATIIPLMYPMSMNIGLYHKGSLLARADEIKQRLKMHDDVIDQAERKRLLGHEMEDFLMDKYQTRAPGLSLCDEVSVLLPSMEELHGGKVPRARIICPDLDLIKYQSTYPNSNRYGNTDL